MPPPVPIDDPVYHDRRPGGRDDAPLRGGPPGHAPTPPRAHHHGGQWAGRTAGIRYEAKDARGRWWPAKITGTNHDATLRVTVHDGKGTLWPVVHTANVRLASEHRHLAPPPVLAVVSQEREFCSDRYQLEGEHQGAPYWITASGGCMYSTRRRLWAVGTQPDHREREVGLLFSSHDHGGTMPDGPHRWVHRRRDEYGDNQWSTAQRTFFYAPQCASQNCLEVVTRAEEPRAETAYCEAHECREDGCRDQAAVFVGGRGYCLAHAPLCAAPGCGVPVAGGGEYCNDHRCGSCGQLGTRRDWQGELHCDAHAPRCASDDGCNLWPKPGSAFCDAHSCAFCAAQRSVYDRCPAHLPGQLVLEVPEDLAELQGLYVRLPAGDGLRYRCEGAWCTVELAQTDDGWCLRRLGEPGAGPGGGGAPLLRTPAPEQALALAPWDAACGWLRREGAEWLPAAEVRCRPAPGGAPPAGGAGPAAAAAASPRRDPEGSCAWHEPAGRLADARARAAERGRFAEAAADRAEAADQAAAESARGGRDAVPRASLAAEELVARAEVAAERGSQLGRLTLQHSAQLKELCARRAAEAAEEAEREEAVQARSVGAREVGGRMDVARSEVVARRRGAVVELLCRQGAARQAAERAEAESRRRLESCSEALAELSTAVREHEEARATPALEAESPPLLAAAQEAAAGVAAWLQPLRRGELRGCRDAAAAAAAALDAAQGRCRDAHRRQLRPEGADGTPGSPAQQPGPEGAEGCDAPQQADGEAQPVDSAAASPRVDRSALLRFAQARDAARTRAVEAQEAWLGELDHPEVAAARARYEADRGTQLEAWAAALAECGALISDDSQEGARFGASGDEVIDNADAAVRRATEAVANWREEYSDELQAAALRSDAAHAATQGLLELRDGEQPEAVVGLRDAAAAERRLRVGGPASVRPVPEDEVRHAAGAALGAIELAAEWLQAVCAERAEVSVQLERLRQGERAAASIDADMDALWALRDQITEQRREVRRLRAVHVDCVEAVREQQGRPPHRRDAAKLEQREADLRSAAAELSETRAKQQLLQQQAQETAAALWRVAQEHLPEVAPELALLVRGDVEHGSISADVGGLLVTRSLDDYDDSEMVVLSAPDARRRVIRVRYLGEDTVLKEFALASATSAADLLREVRMYACLRHPSIAQAQAAFIDDSRGCAFIHFPAYPRDLATWMDAPPHDELSEVVVLRIVRCLLHGLEHIHGQGLVHADVHDRNIVMSADNSPLFIDFELARVQPAGTDGRAQTTVTRIGGRIDFLAPELCVVDPATQARARHPDAVATPAADVYGLGRVLQQLCAVPAVEAVLGEAAEEGLAELAAAMTLPDPAKRPTAGAACLQLSRTQERAEDALSDQARVQGAELEEYRRRLCARSVELADAARGARDQEERLRAAEEQLRRAEASLTRRAAELAEEGAAQRETIATQRRAIVDAEFRVRAERSALEQQELRLRTSQLRPPAHWLPSAAGEWHLRRISESDREMACLRECLEVTCPGWLGLGREQRGQGGYSRLQLTRAWRLEHHGLWRRYAVARDLVRNDLRSRRLNAPEVQVRPTLARATAGLPGELSASTNEHRLLHGTAPNLVLSILANGLNERFSTVAAFGHGTYLTECAGKADQYATTDGGYGELPELHRRLYSARPYPDPDCHPGDVHYVFLCRTVLGWAVRTKDGTRMDPPNVGWPVYANGSRRELAPIPGVDPPLPHHSLLAEFGPHTPRYREFVMFHSEQVCPEYLLAYRRR